MQKWSDAVKKAASTLNLGFNAKHLVSAVLGTVDAVADRKVMDSYLDHVLGKIGGTINSTQCVLFLDYSKQLTEITHNTTTGNLLQTSLPVLRVSATDVLVAKDAFDRHPKDKQCRDDLIRSFRDFWAAALVQGNAQALHFPVLSAVLVLGMHVYCAIFRHWPKDGLHKNNYALLILAVKSPDAVLTWLNNLVKGSPQEVRDLISVRFVEARAAKAVLDTNGGKGTGKTILGYKLDWANNYCHVVVGWLDTGAPNWAGGTEVRGFNGLNPAWKKTARTVGAPPTVGELIKKLPGLGLQDYHSWWSIVDLECAPQSNGDLSSNFGNRFSTLLREFPKHTTQLRLANDVVDNIQHIRDAVDATIAPMSDVT